MLSALAYAAVALALFAVARLSRNRGGDARSRAYVLALTTTSGLALFLFAPDTHTVIAALTGRPHLADHLGGMLQAAAASLTVLLAARATHADTMTSRAEWGVCLIAGAIQTGLAALAALPASPAHAAAFQTVWCVNSAGGTGYYVWWARAAARAEPDRMLRISVRITLANTSMRVLIAAYAAAMSIRAATTGQVLIGLTTPALIAATVATTIGSTGVVTASLAPTTLGLWVRARTRWCAALWTCLRLRSLWHQLTTAVPDVRLNPHLTRGVRERATRYIVEIRDAQTILLRDSEPRLSGWVDRMVTADALPAHRAPVELAAAQLLVGLARRHARPAPHPPPNPTRPPSQPAYVGEVRWLRRISTAMRHSRTVADLVRAAIIELDPAGDTAPAQHAG